MSDDSSRGGGLKPIPEPDDGHTHRWTRMTGDGWWRCVCGVKAPDEKQPKLRAQRAAAAEEQADG